MDAEQLERLLNDLGASPEGKKWAEGKTLATVWATLDRADWMGWLLDKMAGKPGWPDASTVRLCACDCAETALKYTIDPRPAEAIRISRLYAIGKATDEELDAAMSSASAAWAAWADSASIAAARATWAACTAWVANAARAASVARTARATWAAIAPARAAAHKQMCALIRKRCGQFEALKEE